jgi:flavin reductase (DIM6/NTAB) family NADH-FMN oxidoreductase RutF
MPSISFRELAPHDRYKLLGGVVVPRPIALVTTLDENGAVNAAPFSFFNVFSEDLPLVVLGLQHKNVPADRLHVRQSLHHAARRRKTG